MIATIFYSLKRLLPTKKIIFFAFFFCCLQNIKAQTGETLIALELPEKSFAGSSVLSTGSSINFQNFKEVSIKITGPKNYLLEAKVLMDKDGKFATNWQVPTEAGDYKMVVKSSDAKKEINKILKLNL